MNQYPLWKYILIFFVILTCTLYALPNLFGEDPAVQISPGYARDIEMTEEIQTQVINHLKSAELPYIQVSLEPNQLLVRFPDTDTQLKAYSLLQEVLPKDYVVAQNLAPATPDWLTALGAKPMYLGLDLRGGVHFLMQVDMKTAMQQDEESLVSELRLLFREERLRYRSINRLVKGHGVRVIFSQAEANEVAKKLIQAQYQDLKLTELKTPGEHGFVLTWTETALKKQKQDALQQNITTLRNRVNELGVAEPIIQQQGEDRIVVQLPGVQDTTRAKEILGATATVEFRLTHSNDSQKWIEAERSGRVPVNARLYQHRDGTPVLLQRKVIATGDQINHAASTIDQQSGQPATVVRLNSKGASRMLDTTKEHVGDLMAVVFIEYKVEKTIIKGKEITSHKKIEEVINVATIREAFGKNFQITGLTSNEARNLALLLRAGALKAPMEIVEERTIGPSLGKENIEQGQLSILIGFITVMVFMGLRYKLFGLVANFALLMNVVILIALLSMLQATLTLPGMAGIVLTLGMAVDANVLIFERIREELANRNTPHASIHAGYEKAFSTIADANVTTLIAAIMLLSFGTGPIKGFAVTLSLGIVTSMFTAILVSRAVINMIYGRQKRLMQLSI